MLTLSTFVLSFINRGIISEPNRISGTYCHKTGTRPPSCAKPLQPTVHPLINSQHGKYIKTEYVLLSMKDSY